MTLDLLVVAPHPDDAELGAGGTLAKAARAGRAVGVIDLTQGELGSKGDPETRAREAEAAARVLGLAWRANLGLPDGGVADAPEPARALAALLRRTRPRVVLAPHPEDRHPDHVAAAALARRAVHLAGLARADVEGRPHKPERFLHYPGNAPVRPDLLVDVSDVIEVWEAAVRAFASQFEGEDVSETVGPAGLEARRALRRYWGNLAGVAYAEPLASPRPWLLDLP
ncbi:LmbE family protein [Oceanithermus profundus DSM 14977]|uniref:LmbE family protein n=1 Tax=Oceanithermus profundus (strain DSM 14977 / NBRC 100410 / VKM B-2274 / 506) TaxID=670487 RepID=E4U4I4_OCEP5|nr:bacillithiol biosynthesis deacetylase BshB1 [Oceanithermus profundus]ADR36977.1 LmbE family protein [Oceanithermus profundus DSM 14977]